MFYEIDINGYFICDAPFATEISPTIVDIPPINLDGTGMRKPRWTGTWDAANQVWTNGGWVDDEAMLLAAELFSQNSKVKKQEIRKSFEIEASAPISVSGISYDGGYDSALKLDGAKRLAELVGETSVVFYDYANVAHTLTIAEANIVVTAVANAYQTLFATKQQKMIDVDMATTQADLDLITWPIKP